MFRKKFFLAMTSATFLTTASFSVISDENVVTLKFADWMPVSSFVKEYGADPFMAKATELSNGTIQFDFYLAEQLGRGSESLTLLRTGVADIANVAPAYISERFPLSGVIELPEVVTSSCGAANTFYSLSQPGGALYEAEFQSNGIRPLFTANLGQYRILTNNKNISTIDDMSGMRIRTAGGPMAITAESLNSSAVRMQGSDVLTSLTRGTLDGVFFPLRGILDYGLAPALDQVIANLSVGSFAITYSISDSAWNKLSDNHKNILIEAGRYANQVHCEYVDSAEPTILAQLNEEHGIEPIWLSDDEVAQANVMLEGVYESWVLPLEKRGLPAEEVLNEMLNGTAD